MRPAGSRTPRIDRPAPALARLIHSQANGNQKIKSTRPARIANPKPPNRPPPDPHRRRRRRRRGAYRLVPPSAGLAAGSRHRPTPRLPSRYGESLSYQTIPVCARSVLAGSVACMPLCRGWMSRAGGNFRWMSVRDWARGVFGGDFALGSHVS